MSDSGESIPGYPNLKPIPKGVSGNPAGRPKGARSRSTIIREMIEAATTEQIKKMLPNIGVEPATIFEAMVAAQVAKSLAGDTQAFNAIADSAHGKLTDKVENTHKFTKMGKVVAEPIPDPSAGLTAPAAQAFELSFDIGDAPDAEPETDDDLS